jgi:hypothetical protein
MGIGTLILTVGAVAVGVVAFSVYKGYHVSPGKLRRHPSAGVIGLNAPPLEDFYNRGG